jgi:hypothetical protein
MRHSAWPASIGIALFAIVAATFPAQADDAPTIAAPPVAPTKVVPPRFVPLKPEAAIKVLTDKGLKKLKATTSSIPWVLPDDAKTHEKLADFLKVAAANHAAAKAAKAEAAQIVKDRETLSKAEPRYSELKGYADKPDTIPQKIASRFRNQQEMMQALQQDLNDQVNTLNKLRPKLAGKFAGDMPASLKSAIADWMLANNNLILADFPAKPIFDELDKKYRALADDPEVATALKSLGKKNHLGSTEFDQDRKAMAECEATAMSGEVPFYREGALDSVGAILNETTPVIVRIDSVNGQSASWAPTDVLAKAGITVDPSAPMVTLNFSGNAKRTVQCRLVVVPKLRFGKYVLENVKFLAMPDDAKDLGVQITSAELKGYDQTPDRETWLYKFVKQEQPKPDEAK